MSGHNQISNFAAVRLLTAAVVAAACVTPFYAASAASAFKTIYNFKGSPHDGLVPTGGLVRDKSGVYYGVTTSGGKNDAGTVFQLTPPATATGQWSEKPIFQFSKAFGDFPYSEVIIDKAGALYGTAGYDGPQGYGIVYKLTPPAGAGGKWTGQVLYSFKSDNSGFEPHGRLLMDSDGALYGTTYKGGTGNPFGGGSPCPFGCGVVFKLTPPASGVKYHYTILYTFLQGNDGSHPVRGVEMDAAGALYGTTLNGGSDLCFNGSDYGCGTVFKLKPPVAPKKAWTEQILYRFADNDGGGGDPSELLLDATGNLFGTTPTGGAGKHALVYELSPKNGGASYTLGQLHTFTVGTEISGVTPDGKGGFYGTTRKDGATNYGTAFKLGPAAGAGARSFTILHSFVQADKNPLSNLAVEGNGRLLGYTQSGGPSLSGTIYELTP